ncbi:MAG: hypothetical protein IPN85_00305 [Flavobacteriales bacterium]|jgi:hypothetical protein|nr:hypothetical protein [Flavobacteriales bacterium]MBL0034738.1 hypothetical protein [Flavobacteriales bacterium]
MVHLGNLTVIDQNEPLLMELDPQDLVYLLELPAGQRLGHIVSLNRTVRYGNRLNAFALLERLTQAGGATAEEGGVDGTY